VHPKPLTIRIHQQKIPVSKREVIALTIQAMAKLKVTTCSQRQGGNRECGIDLRLIIRMPTHAVLSIAIEIEKAAIEGRRAARRDLIKQG